MSIQSLKPSFIPVKPTSSGTANDKQVEQLRKACADFESIFIAKMFKSMRESSEENSIFGDGFGADLYQGLFEEKVSEKLAQSGGLGIGKALFDQLSEKITNRSTTGEGSISIRKAILEQSTAKLKQTMPAEAETFSIQSAAMRATTAGSQPLYDRIKGFHHLVAAAAQKYALPMHLIYGVIAQESAGDPQAVSKVGAKGLMQLMDETASDLGVKDSFDPQQNVMGGAQYLREQLDRFDGDLKRALAAYNAGPGNVEKYQGIPPFSETRNYVTKVLSYAGHFKELMGSDGTENL